MEKLSKEKKYLKIIISSLIPKEIYQFILQKKIQKINSDFSTNQIPSVNS